MNKCKECPFQYIDHRKNWKCRLNSKVVNAYGCEEDLSVENRIDNKSDMLREKQDYIDEVKKAGRFDKDSLLTREEQEWKKTRHKMINRKIN